MKQVELNGDWIKITPENRRAFNKAINDLHDSFPKGTGLLVTKFTFEGTFNNSQESFWDKLKFWK